MNELALVREVAEIGAVATVVEQLARRGTRRSERAVAPLLVADQLVPSRSACAAKLVAITFGVSRG